MAFIYNLSDDLKIELIRTKGSTQSYVATANTSPQWDQNNYICFFSAVWLCEPTRREKKPNWKKKNWPKIIFGIFSSSLLECKLLSFNSTWETSHGRGGNHVLAVQPGLQPLQHCCSSCSKASGQAPHSDLSAKQQLLLSVVQSPLKILRISALTSVTFGSNAQKYQHYVPAGRHQRNTVLFWK